MKTLDEDLKTIRDYMALSGYFKPHLEGPIWDERNPKGIAAPPGQPYWVNDLYALRKRPRTARKMMVARLPLGVWRDFGPFDDLLRGVEAPGAADLTPVERLSLVLRFAAGPLRWEATNQSSEHRGIASPRGLYSTEVRLILRPGAGPGRAIYRYLPDEHMLASVRGLPNRSDLGGGADRFWIALVLHVENAATPYGEFAISVCPPEAGIMGAQLALLCVAMGWRSRTSVVFNDQRLGGLLGLEQRSQAPVALLAVDGPTAEITGQSLPLEERTVTELQDCASEMEDYPFALSMMAATRLSSDEEARRVRAVAKRQASPRPRLAGRPETAAAESICHDDVLAVMRRRQSGSHFSRVAPVHCNLDAPYLDALAVDWARLSGLERENELRGVSLSIYLYAITGGPDVLGLYEMDIQEGRTRRLRAGPMAAHLASFYSIPANFAEFALAVTIAADLAQAVTCFGRRSHFMLQQAAGRELHHFCLLAAARGLFARPMRSYNEVYVEADLPIEQHALIMALAGCNRPANPTYDLS